MIVPSSNGAPYGWYVTEEGYLFCQNCRCYGQGVSPERAACIDTLEYECPKCGNRLALRQKQIGQAASQDDRKLMDWYRKHTKPVEST